MSPPRFADEDNEDGPETLSAELASLTNDERAVLAVLTAVGGASLSLEQVATLAEVERVEPILAELERRGLVQMENRERAAPRPGLLPQLRRAWDIVDTADRVLQQLISIAEDGRLALDDLDAVLGLGEWAAEAGRLTELLQLVRAAETALSLTRRVERWVELVERARVTAHELGDREAEAWAEEQLRVCDRALQAAAAREATVSLRRRDEPPPGPSPVRLALATALLAATAGVGFGVGYGVAGGSREGNAAGTTVALPGETATLPGETVTLAGTTITLPQETVTLPGETVTLPGQTVTVTTVEVTTTTVTAAPIP